MNNIKTALKAASFIAAASMLTAVPFTALNGVFTPASLTAYADAESGDLYYIAEDDHVTITGCKSGATAVEIPSSIEGLPVTVIGDYAFDGSSITSVKIPDSVKTIGMWSFCMCTDLKSVTIPDSVELIDIRAFETCTSLSEINLPDKMIELGSKVFEGTPWLDAQRQKNDLVIINGQLIDGYNAKGDVVIPSEVKVVTAGAFEWNENITSVVFPSGVKKLNDSTFFNCTNLKSADLRYVTEIESMSFAGCEKLSELKLSGNLTRINSLAFADIKGSGSITVYGSKSDWDKVENYDEEVFLKNSKFTFDESAVLPAEDVEGDVNADGELTAADLVLMSKWLLGTPGTELANWKAGDLVKDGTLNAYDFVMMRKALVNK